MGSMGYVLIGCLIGYCFGVATMWYVVTSDARQQRYRERMDSKEKAQPFD